MRDPFHYTAKYRGKHKAKYTDKYAEHSIYNLKYSVPKEITIVFHNRSNYDYHFLIKDI